MVVAVSVFHLTHVSKAACRCRTSTLCVRRTGRGAVSVAARVAVGACVGWARAKRASVASVCGVKRVVLCALRASPLRALGSGAGVLRAFPLGAGVPAVNSSLWLGVVFQIPIRSVLGDPQGAVEPKRVTDVIWLRVPVTSQRARVTRG